METNCPSCNAKPGTVHNIGCDVVTQGLAHLMADIMAGKYEEPKNDLLPERWLSKEKFLGQYMFFFGHVMIGVVPRQIGRRWQLRFTNWDYDKVMAESYRWSLFIGPIEIRLYK